MFLKSDQPAKSQSGGKIRRYAAIVLLSALVLWMVLVLAGRLLQPVAIKQIAELTGTQITTKSARLSLTGAVRLKNLSITPRGETKYDNTFFTADTVYARFRLSSLLTLKPKLKMINVRDFVLSALYDTDSGKWNFPATWFTGVGGKLDVPEMELENGLLKYGRIVRGEIQPVMEIPLALTMEKDYSSRQFELTTGSGEFGANSVLKGSWNKGKITISGGIRSDDTASLEKLWKINTLTGEMDYDRDGNYTLQMGVKDFQYSSRQIENLSTSQPMFPEGLPFLTYLKNFFEEYRPEGKIDIKVRADGNFYKFHESKFAGALYCKDVSVCDVEFPYTIEDITGKIDFTENSYNLNELRGTHKDAEFLISGWEKDFGQARQYDFHITSDGMDIDEDLYNALNADEQKMWSDFGPKGKAALDFSVSRQLPAGKKSRIEMTLQSMEAVCKYFPYPLRNLSGKVIFEGGRVIFSDIISQTDKGRITINGQTKTRGSANPDFDIKIKAEGVPLDAELAEALPEKQRQLWKNLNLGGVVDSDIQIRSVKSGTSGFVADISIKKGELKANAAAINPAIKDVSVKATITADMVHIEELKGKYGNGSISLHGQVWPGESAQQNRYDLSLFAEQVELDDTIINLLSRQQREIAEQLNPRGKVNIVADFNKAQGEQDVKYKVSVNCAGIAVNLKPLNCRLKDIDGDVRITNDRITLEHLTAKTVGTDRMTDEPAVTIDGEVTIKNSERKNTKLFDLAGGIKFNDCDLDEMGKLTEISGLLKVIAAYDTGAGLYRGQADFNIKHIIIDGKLLTNVNAFIGYDPKEQSWISKNLIADCYDGKLTGKLAIKPSYSVPEYTLQAGLNNIDLRKFLEQCRADYAPQAIAGAEMENSNCTSGKMSGSLNVTGHIGSSFPSMGRCKLVITEMQVGKMSLLAKILSVLKLSSPEDYAFDQMLIDSYIENKKLNLEKINLSGKTLAFSGSGSVDLDSRDINVVLTARGKHLGETKPSILQSLTDAISLAVVRIDVTGDFYDPKVETTTLPVLKDPLGILGTRETEEKK